MFKTKKKKVEWEACVGESRLQCSIFSRRGSVPSPGSRSFCASGGDSDWLGLAGTRRGLDVSFFFFCVWNKTTHNVDAAIIAHRLLFGKR